MYLQIYFKIEFSSISDLCLIRTALIQRVRSYVDYLKLYRTLLLLIIDLYNMGTIGGIPVPIPVIQQQVFYQ